MSDFMTDDHYIKKKKKKADVMYSENVSFSEYNEGSAKKKKKKKHKHTNAEDETVIEVSSSDNLSPSYNHSSFAEHEEQERPSEQEVSTEDYSNTWKSPKKSKKKKRRESSEEIKLETEHADQTSLYNEHMPSDEAQLSQSVKKRKKKHRLPVLEEEFSADVQQKSPIITLNENTDVESRPSKKKKMASPKKSSQDVDTETPSTFSDERGPKTDGCLSPKVRRSRKVSVAEDMPLNEKTDLENADVSGENTCENVTETTGYETDDNMGTVTKTKKSAKRKKSKENHQDQDMTEELDNLNETAQIDITLDEETSDPKEKKSDSAKRRRSSTSGRELLSTIREKDLALLEEYFPRIRSMSARTISELISCELKRVGEAKRKGIMFQTGRFDSTEDELIKKNVEEFMKLAGLESGEMLFYSYRFPDKKSTIESLKKKYHFRQRIAQGIARSVTEVNNRGSKLYDLSGNKGRYTKEEVEKLQKGVSEHGNDWITIGKSIGRNCKNVQLKASQLRRVVTGGKWHTEEVNRLIQAVKEFILSSMKSKKKKISSKEVQAVPKQMLFSGIPWAKIEEKVKTRNWTHCKSKWNDILLLRMNDGISPCEGVLGLQTTKEIINWLHAAELPKGQVNWLQMAKDIGNIPPGILQQKVYKLKSRHVPEWQDRSFKEIVDCLYEEVLPKVETSLQDSLTNLISVDGNYMMPEKKDTFLIRDIFQEYIGDDRKSAFIDDSNSDDSS